MAGGQVLAGHRLHRRGPGRRHAAPALRIAVAALTAAALAAAPGAAAAAEASESARALREDWLSAWTLSPFQLLPLVLGAVLYGVRARRLGPRLPLWRAACFFGGVLVIGLGVASPLDRIGEDGLFAAHMLQHVLIGDIAALLLVLGVTGPILRPALALAWVQRLRVLAHPLVALPLWTVNIVFWHVPALYQSALEQPAVHAVEHLAFLTFGCVMWAAVVEPLPGPAWFGTGAKILYVGGVRVVETLLGNVFWFSGTVLYPAYAETAPLWGADALEDQVNAGTVMMVEGGLVTLVAIVVLFFRMARESEVRQALIEGGVDPAAARRAVRYGRGQALAERHGVTLGGGNPGGLAPTGGR